MRNRAGLREPVPIWPDEPRLCPDRPLPAYRFVAGLTPRPVEHRLSVVAQPVATYAARIAPDRWRENGDYLWGIDLYHNAYFWEAHEAWERVWTTAPSQSAEALFLQALIQNAAAQIKYSQDNLRGARRLSRAVYRRLREVLSSGVTDPRGRFMGLRVADLFADIERYYGPLWAGSDRAIIDDVAGRPPRLHVEVF